MAFAKEASELDSPVPQGPELSSHPTPSGDASPLVRARLPELSCVTAFAAAFMAAVESVRPLPFSSTDDAILHQGPVIKLHTDAALQFSLPRMFWELGSGWSPFESGQAGVFYPLYHLANVVSRFVGRPLALLDISAALHLWIAGLVCAWLLPSTMARRDRIAWSCLAVAQPAPFLLGLNWHSYLSPYPWFLAIALLLMRNGQPPAWPRADRLLLLLASTLFFLCVHPQMYLLAVMALGACALGVHGRPGLTSSIVFACAQLPFAVPLLYLYSVGENASANWLAGRTTADFILFESQGLKTVLYGLFTGNLLGDGGFRLWQGVSWVGQGMFFAPWLAWSLALAMRQRRFGWLVLASAFVLIMGITSVPWLAGALAGPLRFRWTWKLACIAGPLALVATIAFVQSKRTNWARTASVSALALVSAMVCLRGSSFDIFPSAVSAHSIGIEGIAAETKAALSQAGARPGARIALIAAHPINATVPIPMVGLTGNAPVLSGYESAHLFEPLENADAAASHYGLSTPWRGGIAPQKYAAETSAIETALVRIGVEALVSNVAGVFPSEQSTAFTDSLGRVTYVRRLEASAKPIPWDVSNGSPNALERLPGGRLRTLASQEQEPVIPLPRIIEWHPLPDGRWEGVPVLLGESGELWVLGTLLGALVGMLIVLRAPLHRFPFSSRKPDALPSR